MSHCKPPTNCPSKPVHMKGCGSPFAEDYSCSDQGPASSPHHGHPHGPPPHGPPPHGHSHGPPHHGHPHGPPHHGPPPHGYSHGPPHGPPHHGHPHGPPHHPHGPPHHGHSHSPPHHGHPHGPPHHDHSRSLPHHGHPQDEGPNHSPSHGQDQHDHPHDPHHENRVIPAPTSTDQVPCIEDPISGHWSHDTGVDISRISKEGDVLHITNPHQPWSPSKGRLHPDGSITFTEGGLKHLAAKLVGDTIKINNNTNWFKLDTVSGSYGSSVGSDVTVIEKKGNVLHCTNAHQPWSPAIGHFNPADETITFEDALHDITGHVKGRAIHFSNGTFWPKVDDISGSYSCDTGSDISDIRAEGETLFITNPDRSWSPSKGQLRWDDEIVFTEGGLKGLFARFDGHTIYINNKTKWFKQGTHDAGHTGRPLPVVSFDFEHVVKEEREKAARARAVLADVCGAFVPGTESGLVLIRRRGDALLFDAPSLAWSPSEGHYHPDGRITFTRGGLSDIKGLTAEHRGTTIAFSDGRTWQKA